MSEENPQTPAPEDKSSSVPLKKETTRVTLKASEGSAPPPPAPAAPKPAAPAQATQPLAPSPAPSQPAAAKTVPLNPAPAAQSSAPQATVKLQPSQPGAASTPGGVAAPLSTGKLSASLDDDGEESGLVPLGWVCLVFALILLGIEFLSSPTWSQQDKTGTTKKYGIPFDDYDRKYNPQVDNKENKEAKTFKFTKTDSAGKLPPQNLFPGQLKRSLPTKEYDDFKGAQN